MEDNVFNLTTNITCSAEEAGTALREILNKLYAVQEVYGLDTGTVTRDSKGPLEIFDPNSLFLDTSYISPIANDTITIKKSEYYSLLKDSIRLAALERGGVDNWTWYGESLDKEYQSEIEEVEEMERNDAN